MKAWTFQDPRQKQKHGKNAAWYVGWMDPQGRRRSKRIGQKSSAEKYRRRIEGQLAAGTYEDYSRKQWKEFRAEFEKKFASGMKLRTRQETLAALDVFARVAKPVRVSTIDTAMLDKFVARRRMERGRKKESVVSPATVNKELRHVKSTLRIAHEWGYLPRVPKVRMLKEPKKLIQYVTAEHFAAIYQACDVARLPEGLPYPAADWWRALLTFGYMTGWRIGETLALRRADVDYGTGHAITRHSDNKGGRDERVKLHPVVLDHIKAIATFDCVVFPWSHDRRTLDSEFHRIQRAAGVRLPCIESHEHTPACHCYGFHDLRRAFATMNAAKLSGDALQSLMRHKSYSTTQRYINMARQLDEAVNVLHVPEVLSPVAHG